MSGRAATSSLTLLALVAFAANSILCRMALGGHRIDAAGFALVRLAAGAVTLGVLRVLAQRRVRIAFAVVQPLALFLYAVLFALAYVSLPAGVGALILFGCVQATMIVAALRSGERFRALEAIGLAVAIGGLAWLVAPGLTAPSPVGSALMAGAGIAWGVYSLRGRGSSDPLGDTARNFALATPLAVLVAIARIRDVHVTPSGAVLAIASGALTSGVGYVVWFAALRGLSAIRAAIVQLAVPALAAAGGVLFLHERVSVRLVIAGALILGGVGLAIGGRARDARVAASR